MELLCQRAQPLQCQRCRRRASDYESVLSAADPADRRRDFRSYRFRDFIFSPFGNDDLVWQCTWLVRIDDSGLPRARFGDRISGRFMVVCS